MLNVNDIYKIVNAVYLETEYNEEFKAIALSDVEQAIKLIIDRDFPQDVLRRYNRTIKYYRDKTHFD